ncbi:MAG: TIGR03905 family TSCPD domain-containing protein [Erysipelotrichaceae bacterium]
MKFDYAPNGVCSRKFEFEIENDVIKSLVVTGGCQGNLAGISKLLVGMNIDEVIDRLQNVCCGMKKTSCPDQIAKALIAYKNQ